MQTLQMITDTRSGLVQISEIGLKLDIPLLRDAVLDEVHKCIIILYGQYPEIHIDAYSLETNFSQEITVNSDAIPQHLVQSNDKAVSVVCAMDDADYKFKIDHQNLKLCAPKRTY
ncbi:hypothetical protein [Chitinimonas sp. BJYL2]|uniref:hypothetical protein n=1 Tax=Chitinimonas sp. BJYL2 TaxID=2976696 RepID=UPI0022B3C84F|nr:hypothetical protein [Chitinimonas sp. BJYL2]